MHSKALQTLVALLVLVAPSWAQIIGPSTASAPPCRWGTVEVVADADLARYKVVGDIDVIREYDPAPGKLKLRFMGPKEGVVGYIFVAAVKGTTLYEPFICKVTITGTTPPGPVPPGPKPPEPKPPEPKPPEPKPPEPKPPEPKPVDPVPFPADKLTVLVTYETGTVASLPREQYAVLVAKSVREFLEAKCPNNYLFLDKDADASKYSTTMDLAMKVANKQQQPWVVISNGKTGFSGPLPKNAADFQALVEKYSK